MKPSKKTEGNKLVAIIGDEVKFCEIFRTQSQGFY